MDYGLKDYHEYGRSVWLLLPVIPLHGTFSDFERKPSDYDAVFTGDLGIIRTEILLDLLSEQNIQLSPHS